MKQPATDPASRGNAADEQPDYDLTLWSEVVAMMACTYELANRITGANLPPEKIMELANSFACEFMRRRAAMIGGAE